MMDVDRILQKLCKWRGVFAGWQLGRDRTRTLSVKLSGITVK
jgi:hypothetical protein